MGSPAWLADVFDSDDAYDMDKLVEIMSLSGYGRNFCATVSIVSVVFNNIAKNVQTRYSLGDEIGGNLDQLLPAETVQYSHTFFQVHSCLGWCDYFQPWSGVGGRKCEPAQSLLLGLLLECLEHRKKR